MTWVGEAEVDLRLAYRARIGRSAVAAVGIDLCYTCCTVLARRGRALIDLGLANPASISGVTEAVVAVAQRVVRTHAVVRTCDVAERAVVGPAVLALRAVPLAGTDAGEVGGGVGAILLVVTWRTGAKVVLVAEWADVRRGALTGEVGRAVDAGGPVLAGLRGALIDIGLTEDARVPVSAHTSESVDIG